MISSKTSPTTETAIIIAHIYRRSNQWLTVHASQPTSTAHTSIWWRWYDGAWRIYTVVNPFAHGDGPWKNDQLQLLESRLISSLLWRERRQRGSFMMSQVPPAKPPGKKKKKKHHNSEFRRQNQRWCQYAHLQPARLPTCLAEPTTCQRQSRCTKFYCRANHLPKQRKPLQLPSLSQPPTKEREDIKIFPLS